MNEIIGYKIKLKMHGKEIKLTKYQDDTGYSRSTQPTSPKDFEVVDGLKGLMKKLNLSELNAELTTK